LLSQLQTVFAVLKFPVNADVQYLNNFTNLSTRTHVHRPKNDIGGSITMIAGVILDEIGRGVIEKTFFVGNVSLDMKMIDSHFTLVSRNPENALWIRSESPFNIVSCELCGSELHAFDGPAHVVASRLTAPIYSEACSANGFVIRDDIAGRLRTMAIPEMVIEPIRIKQPIA